MKKIIFVLAVLCVVNVASLAQNSQVVNKPDETKWEYLVVSFGKTLFSTPEKMMAYKNIGLPNGQESIELQSSLDILGRFGWELISIVGSIGGDQQIVLKRKYDKARSANEYGLIQSGKEIYLKDLQDIIERTQRLFEEQRKIEEQIKSKPELVNLDEVERLKKREESRVYLENIYRTRFESTEVAKNANFSLDYKNSFSEDILINITIDLTEKFLINGNSYHRDEVYTYIKSFLEAYKFKAPTIDKYSGISIHVGGNITFNGNDIRVVNCNAILSYSGIDWSVF